MNNPFAKRGRPSGWVFPVSVIMLVIGFMMSTAFIRSKDVPVSAPSDERPASDPAQANSRISALETEVNKLNAEKTQLEGALADKDKSTGTLNNALQDAKRVAAMTVAEGPGIMVILTDSQKSDTSGGPEGGIVHDQDIIKVVNELWNAGAEAVSVDDRRIGPSTNIRCVGSTIEVDQHKIASPITIKAIGSTKDLSGALNLPGGVVAELRQVDPGMIRIDGQKVIRLQPWTGSTSWNYGSVPKDSNK